MKNDHRNDNSWRQEAIGGFSLLEMLLATAVLSLVATAVFTLLTTMQQETSYRGETQSTLDNARVALETVEKYLRQAGNDPLGAGVTGITIISEQELELRADLKGSLGAAHPDKGDPDGDTDDPDETVRLRYNPANQSLEVVSAGGTAQIVSNHIKNIVFHCYDDMNNLTTDGSRVRRVVVTITGAADYPHPRTKQVFSVELQSEVRILS